MFCKRHFATAFYTPVSLLLRRSRRRELKRVHYTTRCNRQYTADKVFSFQTILVLIEMWSANDCNAAVVYRPDLITIKYVMMFLNLFIGVLVSISKLQRYN